MYEETFHDIIDKCQISVTLSRHITPDEKLLHKLKLLNFEVSPTEPRVVRSDSFPSPQTLLSFIETLRNNSNELRGAKVVDKENTGHNLPYTHSNRHSKTEAAKGELEFSIDLNKLKLSVSSRHALDLKADLIIVVGEPNDVLSGHSRFKAADLIELDIGEKINNVKTMKLKKSSYIFQLMTDDFTEDVLTKDFVNLAHTVDVMMDSLNSIKCIVFTSNFLYPENNTEEEIILKLDSFGIRKFTQLIYDFAMQLANKTSSLEYITMTTSEAVYHHILKVFPKRELTRINYDASETEFEDAFRENNKTTDTKMLLIEPSDKVKSIQQKEKLNEEETLFFSGPKYSIRQIEKKVVESSGEVKAVKRKIHPMIRNDEMNTPWQYDKNTEDDSSTHWAPSYGGARAKDVIRETTENTRQKKHQFPIKGTTNETISGKRYIYSTNDTTLYIGCTGLEISVHMADITKLRVDCIVNATNRHLRHGGGVAYLISKAAGYDLQYECERYIEENKSVQVSGVFVSTGGDLPAKHVIHAVGPKWDDYVDKNKCTDDLRRTVLTCLLEATKMKMSTIALPSISAAIFKVPKDLCAEAYMHAVKSYDAIVQKLKFTALKEIQFVDINYIMIDTINEHFLKLWHEEILDEFYKEDLNFADSYMKKQSQSLNISRDKPYKQNYQEKQDVVASSHTNTISRPKEYNGEERKSATLNYLATSKTLAYSFLVQNVKLDASPKLAFEFKPNLVIIIGDPFDKLRGHSEFKTADLYVIDTGKRINNVKTFTSTMRDQDPIYVFQLAINEFNQEQLEKSFKNLEPAVGLMKYPLASLVVTSKFLYPDKENSKKSAFFKSVGKFAQLVYEFVRYKTDKMDSLKYVTVTASEDILPHIVKVFQARENDRTAQGYQKKKDSLIKQSLQKKNNNF